MAVKWRFAQIGFQLCDRKMCLTHLRLVFLCFFYCLSLTEGLKSVLCVTLGDKSVDKQVMLAG